MEPSTEPTLTAPIESSRRRPWRWLLVSLLVVAVLFAWLGYRNNQSPQSHDHLENFEVDPETEGYYVDDSIDARLWSEILLEGQGGLSEESIQSVYRQVAPIAETGGAVVFNDCVALPSVLTPDESGFVLLVNDHQSSMVATINFAGGRVYVVAPGESVRARAPLNSSHEEIITYGCNDQALAGAFYLPAAGTN